MLKLCVVPPPYFGIAAGGLRNCGRRLAAGAPVKGGAVIAELQSGLPVKASPLLLFTNINKQNCFFANFALTNFFRIL